MSGLCVRLSLDGPPASEAHVRSSLSRLAHRPADRSGWVVDGPVGLSIAERWLVPGADTAAQPRTSPCGRFTAMLDGRLDYVDELTRRLGIPADATDVDIALAAHATWGADAAAHLLGDYVLVVWERDQRRLVISRDSIGGPPLYWWCDGRVFIAGSEIQQLIGDLGRPPPLNEGMLAEVLAGSPTHPTETLYRGIERLAPAHVLTVTTTGGPTLRRYWDIEPSEELRLGSDAEYAELWRCIVSDAIRWRTRSIGPVAVDVSGGLDSSSIALLAARIAKVPIVPLTATYAPGTPAYEAPYWQAVHEALGVEAILDDGDRVAPGDIRLQVQRSLDVPTTPDTLSALRLRSAAAERGARAVLSGHGGDQWWAFSCPHFLDLVSDRRHLPALGELLRCTLRSPRSGLSLGRTWLSPIVVPILPRPVLTARRRRRRLPHLTSEFSSRNHLTERLVTPRPPKGVSAARRSQYAMLNDPYTQWIFNLNWRESARAGVDEFRPFFDRRVIEFAFRLPCSHDPAETRVVQRLAVQDVLPASVRSRTTKAEFSQVYVEGIRSLGGTDRLNRLRVGDFGWVRRPVILDWWRAAEEQARSGVSAERIFPLWGTASIDEWLGGLDRGLDPL